MIQNSIVISSEQEAWHALESFLSIKNDNRHIEFDGWPSINMVIKGERYSSSLPANLLTKLSYLQFSLNTFYGKCVYGGNARNLKKHDKKEIELLYTIKKGSTDIKADATGLLNKLGEAMNSTDTNVVASVTMLTAALIISGAVVLINNSDNEKDIEVERLKTIERVIEKHPNLKSSIDELDSTLKNIILSVPDASDIEISGHKIESIMNMGELLALPEHIEEISGDYKIDTIRGYKNHYTIEFSYNKNIVVRAKVNKKGIDKAKLKLLADSLANDTKVHLIFTANKIDGALTDAKIVSIGV
jgi:hypothetical protein